MKKLLLTLIALTMGGLAQAMKPQQKTTNMPQRAQLIAPKALQKNQGMSQRNAAPTNSIATQKPFVVKSAAVKPMPANAMPQKVTSNSFVRPATAPTRFTPTQSGALGSSRVERPVTKLQPSVTNATSIQKSTVVNSAALKSATMTPQNKIATTSVLKSAQMPAQATVAKQPITAASLAAKQTPEARAAFAQKGREVMGQQKSASVASVQPKAASPVSIPASQPVTTAAPIATAATSTGSSLASSLESNVSSQLNTASQSLTSKLGSSGSGSSNNSGSSSLMSDSATTLPSAPTQISNSVSAPATISTQSSTQVASPVQTSQTVSSAITPAPKKPLTVTVAPVADTGNTVASSKPLATNPLPKPVMPENPQSVEEVIKYSNDQNRWLEQQQRVDAENAQLSKERDAASSVLNQPSNIQNKPDTTIYTPTISSTLPFLTDEEKRKQ